MISRFFQLLFLTLSVSYAYASLSQDSLGKFSVYGASFSERNKVISILEEVDSKLSDLLGDFSSEKVNIYLNSSHSKFPFYQFSFKAGNSHLQFSPSPSPFVVRRAILKVLLQQWHLEMAKEEVDNKLYPTWIFEGIWTLLYPSAIDKFCYQFLLSFPRSIDFSKLMYHRSSHLFDLALFRCASASLFLVCLNNDSFDVENSSLERKWMLQLANMSNPSPFSLFTILESEKHLQSLFPLENSALMRSRFEEIFRKKWKKQALISRLILLSSHIFPLYGEILNDYMTLLLEDELKDDFLEKMAIISAKRKSLIQIYESSKSKAFNINEIMGKVDKLPESGVKKGNNFSFFLNEFLEKNTRKPQFMTYLEEAKNMIK